MVGQYEQHGAAFTHCWHTCTLPEPWNEYGQTQAAVGVLVGARVGGPDVGAKVGFVGPAVGAAVGDVGAGDGAAVGLYVVGTGVGVREGAAVGVVGRGLGRAVGMGVGCGTGSPTEVNVLPKSVESTTGPPCDAMASRLLDMARDPVFAPPGTITSPQLAPLSVEIKRLPSPYAVMMDPSNETATLELYKIMLTILSPKD